MERKKHLIAAVILLVAAAVLPGPAFTADTVKPDEEVILFATCGRSAADGDTWTVPVHGWIFEREDDSVWRGALVGELLKWLELDRNAAQEANFRSRARMFLVDNEGGKELPVTIAGRTYTLPKSEGSGHFRAELMLSELDLNAGEGDWAELTVAAPPTDGRRFTVGIPLVGERGVSVISDLDDTVKVSEVIDKRELLANTFVRDFTAVPGMADAYAKWEERGAVFHYVSAAPWQLYPAYSSFLEEQGFPAGSFSMKEFRVKDRTFFNLFTSPERSKRPVLDDLFASYPRRRFILVGDANEQDAEIYASVFKDHPKQVLHIYIRNPSGAPEVEDRLAGVFQEVPWEKWTVFQHPYMLGTLRWEDAP